VEVNTPKKEIATDLIQALLEHGLLSKEVVPLIYDYCKEWKVTQIQAVHQVGILDERQSLTFFMNELGFKKAKNIESERVQTNSIPYDVAKKNAMFVYECEGKYILVVADPVRKSFIETVRSSLNVSSEVVVCEYSKIMLKIHHSYLSF